MIGFVFYSCVCVAGVIAAAATGEPTTQRYEFTQIQMGVPWKFIVYAENEVAANNAAAAAFDRVEELNAILSDYDPESELSRLSQAAPMETPVTVGSDLWRVLLRSKAMAKQSAGAFDVTVGPVVRLWRRARRTQEMPNPERLQEALQAVGMDGLELDMDRQTVRLTKPAMRLDLGGIAMGYAADEAMDVLKNHGIASAMIDASGDVLVSDPPPRTDGWRIGIGSVGDGVPMYYLLLANASVNTSGDAFQSVEIGGRRYSHIVDPRTGLGLTDRSTVTIIAKDCITSDALATAVSVLGPEKGMQLIEETPSASGLIVQATEGMPKVYKSRRFEELKLESAHVREAIDHH